jgi:Zn-dependent protease with chaperone function
MNTLTWLTQIESGSGGGFFATHPATNDRIEALRKVH